MGARKTPKAKPKKIREIRLQMRFNPGTMAFEPIIPKKWNSMKKKKKRS